MARRGTAQVKKTSLYVYLSDDSDDDESENEIDQILGPRSGEEDLSVIDPALLAGPSQQYPTVEQSTSSKTLAELLFDDLVQESVEQDITKQAAAQQETLRENYAPQQNIRPNSNLSSNTVNQDSPHTQPSHNTGTTEENRILAPRRRRKRKSTLRTETVSEMAFIPPSQQRYMRACMVCSIVRTEQQFKQSGCPNCESFLELTGSPEQIQDCTSQVFDGLLTVSDTSKSWVARHQRLEGYVPGVYAVQVEGVLPEDIIAAAENAGVQYLPRDGSVTEALPTDA